MIAVSCTAIVLPASVLVGMQPTNRLRKSSSIGCERAGERSVVQALCAVARVPLPLCGVSQVAV